MILYLDASALVKLYVSEPDSVAVHQWAGAAELLATSRLASVEILSGLARRQRDHTLTAEALQRIVTSFQAEWEDYLALEVDEVTVAELVLRHPLRALDAVHLAAALGLAAAAPEPTGAASDVAVRFASFDERQRAAAVAEGLAVLPTGSADDDPALRVAGR
jgi:predicted nucleic acid-binding protein